MNTYEFSQEPNKEFSVLYFIVALAVIISIIAFLTSCNNELPIEKEYTVSAVVYFQDGKVDTVSSTVISKNLPQYSLVIRSKNTYLWLFKDRNDYDIIATDVTHFKQIK